MSADRGLCLAPDDPCLPPELGAKDVPTLKRRILKCISEVPTGTVQATPVSLSSWASGNFPLIIFVLDHLFQLIVLTKQFKFDPKIIFKAIPHFESSPVTVYC